MSHLCYGSCNFINHIGQGLCNVLDVAVEFLKLTERATNWVSQAINYVLTQLFRVYRYVHGIVQFLRDWSVLSPSGWMGWFG